MKVRVATADTHTCITRRLKGDANLDFSWGRSQGQGRRGEGVENLGWRWEHGWGKSRALSESMGKPSKYQRSRILCISYTRYRVDWRPAFFRFFSTPTFTWYALHYSTVASRHDAWLGYVWRITILSNTRKV